MSDRFMQSYHDNDAISGKPVDYCQSVWMTHWMRKSCKSENRACNRLSMRYEFQEDNQEARPSCLLSGTEVVTNMSKIAKGIGEVTESKTVNIINESPLASSEKLKRERSDLQPLSMFNHHQKRENVLAQNSGHVSTRGGTSKSQIDIDLRSLPAPLCRNGSHSASMLALAPLSMDSPSRDFHFHHEHISKYAGKRAEYDQLIGKNSLAVTETLKDDFIGLNSESTPYGYQRSTPENSICREGEINESNFILASEDYANNTKYGSKSFIFVHQQIFNNLYGRSRDSLLQQNDVGLFSHDSSTSTSQQPDLFGKQCQKMQNHSYTRLFPKWSTIQDPVNSEKLDSKNYSLACMQPPLHDMEGKKICTAVSSMEEPSRGPAQDSQTNHNFLFRNISFDLPNDSQKLKESTESTHLKTKPSSELFSSCPEYGFLVQPGVNLHSSRSSTGSEAEKEVGYVKTSTINLKNQLSAETDDMYMDAFPENHVSGMASSGSNKFIELKQLSSTSEARLVSPRVEILRGRPKMKYQELPNVAGLSNSGDGRETSTSRTQSLDAEHLLSYADQSTNSKSSAGQSEPSSRWVKRLKLSPVSSQSTKSSKMGEATSHKKVNKFFSKIWKCNITCSELPLVGGHHDKDQDALLLKNGQSSSADCVIQEITLSHPWIQRWSCKVVVPAPKKHKAEVVCEALHSKAKLHELSKKQFPSLAAMALMGKAVGSFSPGEYTKKESFVVWKCKRF